MMYFLTILCGLCAVAVFLPLMLRESRQRRKDAIRQMHTDFVAVNCKLQPVQIYTTHMSIGRRKRRCDICLQEAIADNTGKKGLPSDVSQVHARLWWDGFGFRIAPIYQKHMDGSRSEPKVWVNMIPVPPNIGMAVEYDDIITISDDKYKFKLVDTSARYQGSAKPQPRSARKKIHLRRRASHHTRTARRIRRPGRGLLIAAVVLVLMLALAVSAFARMTVMPEAANAPGERKKDTASVLICGVDQEGLRTDTMMLVYVSGSEQKVGLLSLPRDTITRTESGKLVKLNAIYRGREQEGAEDLLNYVEKYVGYRPDGYLIFNWDLVVEITNLMGGVDVTLDQPITLYNEKRESYTLEGDSHLDGNQTLTVLRHRSGYADADLGRIGVQRKIIKACLEQWVTLDNLKLIPDALDLLQEQSITNLSTKNLLWIAKTALAARDEVVSATLAGYPEYRNKVSYYILNPRSIIGQINDNFNPYMVEITLEDLDVVE